MPKIICKNDWSDKKPFGFSSPGVLAKCSKCHREIVLYLARSKDKMKEPLWYKRLTGRN